MSRVTVASRLGRANGLAGLERASRVAGESFGYEDASLPISEQKSRWLWWAVAAIAVAGLALLIIR